MELQYKNIKKYLLRFFISLVIISAILIYIFKEDFPLVIDTILFIYFVSVFTALSFYLLSKIFTSYVSVINKSLETVDYLIQNYIYFVLLNIIISSTIIVIHFKKIDELPEVILPSLVIVSACKLLWCIEEDMVSDFFNIIRSLSVSVLSIVIIKSLTVSVQKLDVFEGNNLIFMLASMRFIDYQLLSDPMFFQFLLFTWVFSSIFWIILLPLEWIFLFLIKQENS